MGQEYAKVLQALNHDFEVIGRGLKSSEKFEQVIKKQVRRGGLSGSLATYDAPESAIVAVGVESLAVAAAELIRAGVNRILIEKPGGLNVSQLKALQQMAKSHGADVLVAYNRRFYTSTSLVRKMISEDGGAISCIFEFTEWSHKIAPLEKAAGVKEAWLLANSTHVIDLAFHLCGFPHNWCAWHSGALDWHSTAARFCGSGITEKGVLFSYHADWEAPGRWGLEVLTRKRRYILRPMEQLQVVSLGSVKLDNVELDNHWDEEYKPGLFLQTKAFIDKDDTLFCSLDEQLQHCAFYNEIAGYGQIVDPCPNLLVAS